jgi:hypothetical protein
MGSLSDYGETAWVNHLCGTSYTSVATLYLCLCTADPTDAATGASQNEVTNANNYSRKAIAFAAASGRAITQTGAVTYDTISGAAGTVTHWTIADSATHGAGNVLAHGSFSVSKVLVNGSTPSVASGQVVVTINTGAFITAFCTSMLDKMFRNQTYNQPATYVGLTTTTSSDSAGGTEATGNNYSRVLINKAGGGSPAWSSVSGGVTDNANTVTMPSPSGSWGTCVGAVIYDASSSGNALLWDNSLVDQAITSGDTASFAAGAIDVLLT